MLHLAMNGQTPNSQQINAVFGHDEPTFKLVNRPMVHLTYQTAFLDDGKLMLRDDIYGFDGRINAILHSDERRVADVAPPQDPKRDLATMKSNREILRRVERREGVQSVLVLRAAVPLGLADNRCRKPVPPFSRSGARSKAGTEIRNGRAVPRAFLRLKR